MREIKFRAWDGQVMHYGGFSIHATGKVIKDVPWINHGTTVMQFTGVKDEDGRDIYEGDILEYHSGMVPKGSNPRVQTVVRWNKRMLSFEGCFQGIVIGDVCNNPELLNG